MLFRRIRSSPAKFVHVTGVPYAVEEAPDAISLTLEVPPFGRLRAVVNTASALSRAAGCDERLRVAMVATTWDEKPDTGLIECDGMNYRALESVLTLVYEEKAAATLAEELTERARRAVRAEVWGDLCARDHLGIHQIHCRRTSTAVRDDCAGRDGALKLYFAEANAAELYLFKFHGQA